MVKKILFSSSISLQELRKDSILNKSYGTNLDNGKPGFKRMNI
jgi:hypothetical protein